GAHDAQAQEYAVGYYNQYWGRTESYSEQYDPYQELEAMHYNQLYPQQYDPHYNQLYTQQYDPYYDLEAMHHKYCRNPSLHTRIRIHSAAFQEDIDLCSTWTYN